MKKRIIAALCAAVLIPTICVNAEYKESDLKTAVNKAIEWKDSNDNPLYGIGTRSADLYIIALGRLGKKYDYNAYLSGLDGVAAGYGEENNASDMQRTAIAAAAAGGNPAYIGGRDLIADGTYFRDNVAPLGREGVNGYSWALIALDTKDYEIPDWAFKNRNDIIVGILSHQNTDGSFDGSVYDTASAITALAPYCETSGAYTITQNQTGYTFDISPADAVDNALRYLSDEQDREGDWGDLNSTAMTVIALGAMDIDADGDDRFAAKKGTAIDGLMSFQKRNGGFAMNNNTADGEATSLALCALTSHLRYMENKAPLFRMNVNDTVAFETAAPATQKPAATNKVTSTKKPTATTNVTPTKKPTTTKKPSNTMQPTKTAEPADGSPKPSSTPRATKRPALVGPVNVAGPMPTATPEPENAEADSKTTSNVAAEAIIAVIVLLLIGAAVVLWYMKKKGKLKITNPLKKGKNQKDKIYKAKKHRKTEVHRRYEQREKYKLRKKYKK